MPPRPKNPQEIETYLELLAETQARLAAAAAGRDEGQLGASLDGQSWSANQILAHLRGCADLWTHSIYAMLVEESLELPDLSPRAWAGAARYEARPFRESLQAFSLQRQELLRVLGELPPGAWGRTALIGGRTHSVFSQVRRMALHEAGHCDQIEHVLQGLVA